MNKKEQIILYNAVLISKKQLGDSYMNEDKEQLVWGIWNEQEIAIFLHRGI